MSDNKLQIVDNASVTKLIRTFQNSVAGITVDNEAVTLVDSAGNDALIDATLKALRTSLRPFEVLGVYSISQGTSAYSGLGAGSELFQFRWTDATKLAVLLRCSVSVGLSVAASAAGVVDRQLIKATGWTASGTGGTAIATPSKRRTSFPTSVAGDIRIASTAALGAGTKTLDGTGYGIAVSGLGTAPITSQGGNQVLPKVDLYNILSCLEYPPVFVQNEGAVVRMSNAQPTGSTLFTFVDFTWAEVTSF